MRIEDIQTDHLPANIINCRFAAPWNDAPQTEDWHSMAQTYVRSTEGEARLIALLVNPGSCRDPGEFKIASVAAPDATHTTVTLSHNGSGSDFEVIAHRTAHLRPRRWRRRSAASRPRWTAGQTPRRPR
jgi:hypothetical protein